jgi:hypothetical protein
VLSAVSVGRTHLIGLLYRIVGAALDRSPPAALELVGALALAAAWFAAAPARLLAPLTSVPGCTTEM